MVKTTKRILTVLLAVCLLFGMVSFAAGEETAGDTSATSGIDVVIVLDMTNSMRKENNRGNDPFGYRIDATAMLIGMLDMEGSRVAIVPFAGKVMDDIMIKDLTDVSTTESRRDLINHIYEKYPSKISPMTNIGAGLMKANQILLSRGEGETNQPMIVLLSDGENDMENVSGNEKRDGAQVPDLLRYENGEIVNKGNQYCNTRTAEIITQEAYQCAKDHQIPIYTVCLNTDPNYTGKFNMSPSLTAMSRGTGAGKTEEVSATEADKLPAYFAKVLADQIGSSVQYAADAVDVGGGYYEVEIPVLNRSVMETNIILPVKSTQAGKGQISGIDVSTLELTDSNGERQNESENVTIMKDVTNRGGSRGHFAMIKIRQPQDNSVPVGKWKLRFKSDTAPTGINFNILYRYNIKLMASLESATGSSTLYKTDSINVTSYFTGSDNQPSSDESLYRPVPEDAGDDEWMYVKCSWQLYKAAADNSRVGDPLAEGQLDVDNVQHLFKKQIRLSEITLSDGSKLKHGAYKLVVQADGAGLKREVELSLNLENHEPTAEDYAEKIIVNKTDEGRGGPSWQAGSGVLAKTAEMIVQDADNDPVQFSIEPVGDANSYATMAVAPEGGSITYTTVQNGDKVKRGSPEFILSYNDQDGALGQVHIKLEIHSQIDEVFDNYDLIVTPETDAKFKKNTPLTVTASLKGKDGKPDATTEVIEKLQPKVSIKNLTDGSDVAVEQDMAVAGSALEYTVESTGNKAAQWQITVTIDPYEPVIKTIDIPGDNPPKSVAKESVTINCGGEGVPGFLHSLIGEDTPDNDPMRLVSVKGLFTDDDGETDTLVYSEPRFINPDTKEETDPAVISATGTDGNYTIKVSGEATGLFHYSMQSEMHITATDGDGKTADFVRTITIVDLHNKMITYLLIILAAIVALIILILIIHQIRKPRFPMLNMTIREEPSLYETGSEPLSPVKTPTNVNAIGVDGDMANKHGISMELLQNIIVRPIRSRTSVGVVCKKAFPGHEVLLEDVRLKPKKLYTWKIGEDLTVRSENGEGLVAIKLEDRTTENVDVADEFEDDSWTTADEIPVTTGGRKHSKKTKRQAPTVEDTSSDAGGGDDFDF